MPTKNKCAYNGCDNSSRTCAELSFHRFPNDVEARKEWIVRVGKSEWLQLEPEKLKNHRICSAHFEQTDFQNYDRGQGKRTLKLKALPAANKGSIDSVQVDSSVESTIQSSSTLSISDTPGTSLPRDTTEQSESVYVTRREQILRRKVVTLTDKLKKARNTIRNLKRKTVKNLTVADVIEGAANYLKGNCLLLLKMQLNHIKPRLKWSEDEKQFALGLFYKSPKAYVFLRKNKKIALPCLSLIRKWINEIHLTTGISDRLFKLLKLKAETMTQQERQCVLMWDEMAIKKLLEYNPKDDLVEGFQDLGHLDRSDKIANYVLVYMLRGLTFTWKQPVAFYVSHGNVDGNDLTELTKTVLNAVFEAGFLVRSMVCDQGSPNRKAVSMLGITEEHPFVDISGNKVFFNFDVPHLIKSIRNNLYSRDFIVGENRISWGAIRELRNVERNKSCRAAPKLTDRHIDPNNFQRMNVRLATQVFSASVSAAMTTGSMTGDLKHPDNSATANFVKKINDIFDCLNSRYANDPNPLKRALSDRAPQVSECLENALPWLDQWTVSNSPSPPCFAGLKMAIRSILMFWSDLRAEGTLYLLTTRLNQDPLENQFSVLRSRSGHNDNPSAKQFRHNLQYVITMNLEKPPVGTNCEEDDAIVLLAKTQTIEVIEQTESSVAHDLIIEDVDDDFDETDMMTQTQTEDVMIHSDETDVRDSIPSEIENDDTKVTLEECSMKYVAGYLLHKCFRKFDCSKCRNLFVKSNQYLEKNNELLLLFKAYKTIDEQELGHLQAPVDKFHTLIVAAYKRFETEFSCHSHEVNISKYLGRCIHETLTSTDSDFWLANDDCQVHRDFIVDLFVRTHIFYQLKWISRDIRDVNNRKRKTGTISEKPNRKMLKLTHS